MRPLLIDLPTEILSQIFEDLSTADFCALCLTHRHLRTIAESFLYSRIQMTWTEPKRGAEVQRPPITPLLRTLFQRPQLGHLVKSLTLNGCTYSYWGPVIGQNERFEKEIPVTETDLQGPVEYINRLNLAYSETWIKALYDGRMSALVAALLTQLPQLISLHLDKNFTRDTSFMGMMFRSALLEEFKNDGALPSFEHLQDVSVAFFELDLRAHYKTDIRNTSDPLTLFYLPSIERIVTLIDNPITFAWPASQPPNPSRLKSLDLSWVREECLGRILSVAKNLETLTWTWYYRDDLNDQIVTTTIDLDRIARSLFPVRETLTHLTIPIEVRNVDAFEKDVHIKGHFNAFSDLHMLEYLELPFTLLLGISPQNSDKKDQIEDMPRNLRFLTLTNDLRSQEEYVWEDGDLVEFLRPRLQLWKQSASHLQEVHIVWKGGQEYDWGHALSQGIKDLGDQAGIDVKITNELYKW